VLDGAALEIVFGQLGPFLFQHALDDVLVTFDFGFVHSDSFRPADVDRRQPFGKGVIQSADRLPGRL
jgi:hypothetical protein